MDPNTETELTATRQIAGDIERVHPFPVDAIEGLLLLRQLGAGASSTVYLARETETDKEVAIKVLAAFYCRHKEALARWEREAGTLERLRHPNIVEGLRHGVVEGRPYFVMEYVQGEPLSNRLRRIGRLPEEEVFAISRAVLEALHVAHQNGIIHRDIKPSNIVIDPDGVTKLMDFGLAKEESDRSVTMLGTVLGTPVYVSPEQARGDLNVDIRSDLYSLGITLFHLVSNEVPFSEMNTSLLLTRKITDDVPDVRHFAPDVSAGMAFLIRRLCERERTSRPTTPREAIELLEGIMHGQITTAELSDSRPVKKRPIAPSPTELGPYAEDNPVLKTLVEDTSLESAPITLEKNEVLFYEDDTSRDAYILLNGELEVLKSGRQIATINESGNWLGEMSTLLDAPRTATIRATGRSVLLRVEEKHFREFNNRHPDMCYVLACSLAERLDKTNQKLNDSQRRLATVRKHFRMIESELSGD
ncbi:protein kinase [bacterium]|nr:protein kinase [bacterium]